MSDSNNDLPNVSILTITRNRKSYINLMLKNWNGFDYPRDKLEWIILDDGSEDLTEKYSKHHELNKEFTKHPATWLNQGRWDDELEERSGFEDLSTQQQMDEIMSGVMGIANGGLLK